MKRLLLVLIVILLLSGCATLNTPTALDDLPPLYQSRLNSVVGKVTKCIDTTQKTPIVPYSSNDVNGGYINGKIYLSTALFAYSNDVIGYILAHEIAHQRYDHQSSRSAVSMGVTGVMLVAGAIVPGLGLLNHVVNPLVTRNVISKPQELEADFAAYKACICMGMTKDDVVASMKSIRDSDGQEGGGVWAAHPPWSERIKYIQDAPDQS